MVLRCSLCVSYGDARWIFDKYLGDGNIALCTKHKEELIAEKERHEREMDRLRTINYEQHDEYGYEYSMKDKKYKWMMSE